MYREKKNGPSPMIHVFVHFSNSPHFFVKDIAAMVKDANFTFDIHVDSDRLYCGIENQPSPIFNCCISIQKFFIQSFSATIKK